MAQNSDDEIFTSIILSMGIHNYDPLVITALNEYARRYAGSLLLDANDYAEHADRQVSFIHFSSICDVLTIIICKGNLQSLVGQEELSPNYLHKKFIIFFLTNGVFVGNGIRRHADCCQAE